MKRFLLTIWAVIPAFRTLFTALFTSISVLWRGRTIRFEPKPIPKKTAGNADKAAVEPVADGSWFNGIRRMTLFTIHGVCQLDMLLRNPLATADHLFRDLNVSIILRGEHSGIEYVAKDGSVRFSPPSEYRCALEPRSQWDRVHSKRKIELDESNFVSNAVRIELAQGDEKMVFVHEGIGFFLPAANRAA